eukprot:TRINITY_DN3480_c0_g1_i1.p1 TRINITY_DN3480_c0_g1~~TRINITY_DN3480_c0_g1_i1.p1  ORF type:complete len:222 (+),score=54.63 TRINITY_DN3480_c0_g1_i1:871-1536(+)
MKQFLKELRQRVSIGVVGGSDFPKQKEQLGEDALECFDYNFPENGVVAFKKGVAQPSQSIASYLGEAKLTEFINYCLCELADIDIPKKRGTFIEYRTGMINLSPIGRNCTYEERLEYYEYDQKHDIRKKLIQRLKQHFLDLNLQYSIGGQISVDIFPKGWDKTYCLRHVKEENFAEIHFFGDKTMEGGNDYEIYRHELVTGHAITSPEDTLRQCKELFFKN